MVTEQVRDGSIYSLNVILVERGSTIQTTVKAGTEVVGQARRELVRFEVTAQIVGVLRGTQHVASILGVAISIRVVGHYAPVITDRLLPGKFEALDLCR